MSEAVFRRMAGMTAEDVAAASASAAAEEDPSRRGFKDDWRLSVCPLMSNQSQCHITETKRRFRYIFLNTIKQI